MVKELKLTVLTDNYAGKYTKAEHGLSYYIEADNNKILFDSGKSDLFIKNAKILGVNLEDVNVAVLSHGHYDHGNGFKFVKDKTIYCHPDAFRRRYRKESNENIGLDFSLSEISVSNKIIRSEVPALLSDSVWFLGAIPRTTDFESQTTPFVLEDGSSDFISDDSGIVINTTKGLVVITGCGHSGVINTLRHAINVTGENKIHALIGGFHLKKRNKQTLKTIEEIKLLNVDKVIASHCTELPALSLFFEEFGSVAFKTGDSFIL